MFDFHLHSDVSFDSSESALNMAKAAAKSGLKEICFTDHLDYCCLKGATHPLCFSMEEYAKAYDNLHVDNLVIRKGMEFGITPSDAGILEEDLKKRNYDFVIGSVHFVEGVDVYEDEAYWSGKTKREAYEKYLKEMVKCLKAHDNFDVLGHITYISKCGKNPDKTPLLYEDYSDYADEILKLVVQKGRGIELNTSGIDKTGDFLPPIAFLRRFKELGGEIVTVGSDAHDLEHVGKYCFEAVKLVKEIFGFVCTFKDRKPVFHR